MRSYEGHSNSSGGGPLPPLPPPKHPTWCDPDYCTVDWDSVDGQHISRPTPVPLDGECDALVRLIRHGAHPHDPDPRCLCG